MERKEESGIYNFVRVDDYSRGWQFFLREVDESDGVVLRISDISWDGERLHFVTLFPPTKHKASHIFSLIRKGIAAHQVSYSDEDGNHTIDEIWKKARKKQ